MHHTIAPRYSGENSTARNASEKFFSAILMPVAAACRRGPRLQLTRLAISLALITSRVMLNSPLSRACPTQCNNDWYHAVLPEFPPLFFLPRNTQIRKRSENPLWTFLTGRSFYLRRKARKEVGTIFSQRRRFLYENLIALYRTSRYSELRSS